MHPNRRVQIIENQIFRAHSSYENCMKTALLLLAKAKEERKILAQKKVELLFLKRGINEN